MIERIEVSMINESVHNFRRGEFGVENIEIDENRGLIEIIYSSKEIGTKMVIIPLTNVEKIEYIEKKDNSPNVPQARPIEHFWALCKQEYAQRKNDAKNLRSFAIIWKKIALNVSNEHGKSIMASLKQKLRSIGSDGVLYLFK